jgi:streptomycin 6-kinase
VILKISVPDRDMGDEAGVLDRAQERGYVRLLAHDAARGAMLLEALGPALNGVNLPPEQQLETLCRLLATAWTVPPAAYGPLAVPGTRRRPSLSSCAGCGTSWSSLARPAWWRRLSRSPPAARTPLIPRVPVQLHGDAAAANALRVTSPRLGAETGFVFVDPDGFVGDRAYDLGVALRDWCPELLASDDPSSLARYYCHFLAANSGVEEQAIWEWCFLERVSTGLYVRAMGAHDLSRPVFVTAEAML